MRLALRFAFLPALLAGACSAAGAQEKEGCAAFTWSVDREVKAFATPDLPVLAVGQAYPSLGQGVALQLAPQDSVAYAVKPTRKPKASPAYGAQVTLADAGTGGTVAVTLSDDAWVDLVQNGKVLRSTAFSGRKGCPGVRKSVRFAVVPGPVTIAVSDAPAPMIKMDVTPVE